MQNISIRFKLVALTGLFAVFLVGVLIFVASRSITSVGDFATNEFTQAQQTQISTLLKATADNTQINVENFLGQTASTVGALSSLLTSSAVGNGGEPFPRQRIHKMTEDLLKSTSSISALYLDFEKNGYDGKDAQFPQETMYSSRIGTLDVYWVLEDGEYVSYPSEPDDKYSTTQDSNGIRESEWYLCSRDSNTPCLLDPYLYDVSDSSQILMTSYVEPVLVNGSFVGIVGADVNLPKIQQEVNRLAGELFNGQGQITILSQRKLVVGSNAYPDQLGKSIKGTPLETLDLSQSGLTKNANEWTYISHFKVGNAAQEWVVLVNVPTNVLLATAQKLNQELRDKTSSSVGLLIAIAAILAAIGLVLIYIVVSTLTAPLSFIAKSMKALASEEGDLTQRLEQQKHYELTQLAEGFNDFVSKLQAMVVELNEQRHLVAQTNQDFVDASVHVNSSISSQTEQIHSVVTAVTELSSSAFDVADLAHQNENATTEMTQYLTESFGLVQANKRMVEGLAKRLDEASHQIGKVSERSDAIYSILDTIRSIAEQTNLLALNAAIEAARAGEQGRGFAVVADEVRSLAARTQESTEEVDELIKGLQDDVKSAVSLIADSQESALQTQSSSIESAEKLGVVNDRVVMVSENTMQVASAAKEQSNVAEDINQNLVVISDSAKDLRNIVNELESGHDNSVRAVDTLSKILSKLKV